MPIEYKNYPQDQYPFTPITSILYVLIGKPVFFFFFDLNGSPRRRSLRVYGGKHGHVDPVGVHTKRRQRNRTAAAPVKRTRRNVGGIWGCALIRFLLLSRHRDATAERIRGRERRNAVPWSTRRAGGRRPAESLSSSIRSSK